jgi:nucleoside-diphosphate-sugar epimerase
VYAVAKVACENWLKILGTKGLSYTVLRLFSTYGNGHKPNTFQGILNIMLTQLLTGDRVVVKGSLQRQRDLLFAADAADAIVKAMYCTSARGMVINVGTGIPVTVEQLIHTICDVLGRSINSIEIVEETGTVGDPIYNVADISLARKVLSFEPRYSVKEGLSSFIEKRIMN